MTDGAITAKGRAVSISQSANATAMCAKIRAVLGGCGFRFGESHVKRTGIYAHYADNVQFNVSMAEPRKLTDRHLRGCGKLSGWLDKTIPPLYETLDERQLGVLIDSMNDGDGVKAAVSWERRTFSITTGDNEQMADRLQALLVTNGYRCNKATWRPKDRKPQYTLHIRPGARTASVAGMNDSDGAVAGRAYRRSRFSACPSVPGELVWCIGNRVGTLITRRDGKVAVVGNCGRGTRPAPGKRDLLLVDCAGNALRHGLVTRPFPVSLDGLARKHRRAVAGLTTCRTCFRVYEPDEPSCPGCGAARPHTERRIRQVGGELIEMTGAEVFAERATQSQQVRLLARWTREAAARGWKPGAPMARFRGLWKRWPSAQEIREARELAAGGAP